MMALLRAGLANLFLPQKFYYLNFKLSAFTNNNRLCELISDFIVFITSADSGIYVLNNIASRDKSLASPAWQAIMWGTLMSVVAIVLMQSGGLANLQTMTLIVALPLLY